MADQEAEQLPEQPPVNRLAIFGLATMLVLGIGVGIGQATAPPNIQIVTKTLIRSGPIAPRPPIKACDTTYETAEGS